MQLKRALVWILVFTTVVVGYAFERDIREYFAGRDRFELSKLTFADTLGQNTQIPTGYRGYIIFYSDYSGCGVCLAKLMDLRPFAESHDDIAVLSILNEKNDWRQFRESLLEHAIPGEVLHDPQAVLGKRLGLSAHPQLLFFDRHQNLVAMVPMTVRHEKLWKQVHIYAGEM